jgi:nitrate reductase alpha subunit
VLPAATWYEKHDLNTTDMHPFVHSFNPAIAPPWQTRTDWDAWQVIAEKFSALAVEHLGVRKDVVAVPLLHDTPDEMANPHGRVRDWKARPGETPQCEPVPGVTMPKLVEVERDYPAVSAKMTGLGPLLDRLGTTTKGVTYDVGRSIDYLRAKNVERLKPWHTLTGRQHFYLDHDWITEIGEGLPVFRPPLSMGALFSEPEIGDIDSGPPNSVGGGLGVTVRYLTPHNKWSIHSEYQDNLFMLSLSRGGQLIWMSDVDAAKVGIVDNDWIEAVNRNGVVVARAVVSHRMPEGTVYMHHAQDRLIDVPIAETSGRRGGIRNSLTRILIKPSHLIGGYAQLSFAFNYLGPTGNQRDEVTVIRKRSQEVEY